MDEYEDKCGALDLADCSCDDDPNGGDKDDD